MLMVAVVIGSPSGLTSSSKSASLALRMVPKMRFSCALLGAVTLMVEKQAMIRAENWLRPPPGGAMPARSCMSLTCFTSHRWRSYQKPLSTHSFRSSRGGMNPNLDFWGMFRSSMKATSFLPPAGANTPLVRFSSRPSIVSCRELEVVCALKLMIIEARSLGRLSSMDWMIMVLPTPTLPTTMVWLKLRTSEEATKEFRTVSIVGTKILKKGVSGGGLYVDDSLDSHVIHWRCLGSTKYSNTVSALG
mmetsp:Transcript_14243/g.38601  ORF Transcript_14243/g.38601 Transcript_14243/m.38601 type:complete len:247 (-) Transcript_14243:4044-4784(-)